MLPLPFRLANLEGKGMGRGEISPGRGPPVGYWRRDDARFGGL